MALQSSGAISLNDMHVEAGGSSGSQASINDSDIRGLIGKASGAQMSFSEWYGASGTLLTTAYKYAEDDDNTANDESQWKGTGSIQTHVVVPNNGSSNTDTVTTPWADPSVVTINPTFFADWPNNGTNYANWNPGINFQTNSIGGVDYLQIILYDMPTYEGSSTGAADATNQPSPNTNQSLWTNCKVSIKGNSSGTVCVRTFARTSGTFAAVAGYVEADTLSTTTARFPPYVRWNYSGSANSMASTFSPSLTNLTVNEGLKVKMEFS